MTNLLIYFLEIFNQVNVSQDGRSIFIQSKRKEDNSKP